MVCRANWSSIPIETLIEGHFHYFNGEYACVLLRLFDIMVMNEAH